MPHCHWRCWCENDYQTHLRNVHPGYVLQPGQIYDRALILSYILEDGAAFQTAENRALGIISEMAMELGKVEEWQDLCGRQAIEGWCRCNMQQD